MILAPVLAPVLQPVLASPLDYTGGGFSPSQISFTSGLWLDPGDISTAFQDSTGTTPVTASGQQVGLRLDKSLGLALGSEKVLNGDASGGTTSWTQGASNTLTVTNGQFKSVSAVSNGAYFGQNLGAMAAGTRLRIVFDSISDGTSLPASVQLGSANGTADIFQPNSFSFGVGRSVDVTLTSAVANCWVWFFGGSGKTSGNYILVDNISVKPVQGKHALQSTSSARPEYDLISGIATDFFDGADDNYATATFVAGTLTSDMDCFIAYKRDSTAIFMLANDPNSSARYFGAANGATSTAGSATGASGTPTYLINGVAVTGGSSVSQSQLIAAAPTSGTWAVYEVRDLDLSAWTKFATGNYGGGFINNADVAGIILCPAQTSTMRDSIRKWLGARVGLSL